MSSGQSQSREVGETTFLPLPFSSPSLLLPYPSHLFPFPLLSFHLLPLPLEVDLLNTGYVTTAYAVEEFYLAMHFSAKRGIAIACRLSVRLSVTLVDCDHIGWNSSKIISPLVSLWCSLFATPTWRVCSKGNTPKFGPKNDPPVDFSVGDLRSQIAAEWLHIAQRLQWGSYRKLPSLFLMVPLLTLYDLLFPQNGGSICTQHTRMAISLQRVIRSTSCLVLG